MSGSGRSRAKPPALCEEGELSDGGASDVTDPTMPELVALSPYAAPNSTLHSGSCSLAFLLPADLQILLPSAAASPVEQLEAAEPPRSLSPSRRRGRPGPEELAGEAARAESAMLEAEDLLRPAPSELMEASDAKARKLQAIPLLQTAASLGDGGTAEAAAVELLALLKSSDAALMAPAIAGLNACKSFPSRLVGEAAQLLMQRRAWSERGEPLRRLCTAVASADPQAVLGACVELVPRPRAPQMLGFDWLLQPIVAVLGERAGKGDDLPQAVVLLCDDLKGPMSRAAPAKELLRQLVVSAGESAVRRPPSGEDLVLRARTVQVSHWLDLCLSGN